MSDSVKVTTVRYIGHAPFEYDGQLVSPGDTVDLPADDVKAWGKTAPTGFEFITADTTTASRTATSAPSAPMAPSKPTITAPDDSTTT